MPVHSRRRTRSFRAAVVLTAASVALSISAVPAHADENTIIQILGTNDFHGRLVANGSEAGAAVLAGAVKQLRAENPNTVFAAAGDLVGATTFESFIANDKPTIDVLNEAGLEVSAAGNHEFDQGYDDLVDRIMAPYDEVTNPYGGAEWEYIAANVRNADDSPALPESWTIELSGVKVGFVGAVTDHLSELVSPAGIAGLIIEAPIDAANEVAEELKADGADLVILLVHEGAATTDISSATDPTSDMGRIVNGASPDIDAIISGHTHLAYNHKIPVAEWIAEDRDVTERPVVSAGQYGTNLNKLLFEVDPAGNLVSVDTSIVALAPGGTAAFPADSATAAIVAAAVANADVLGAEVLGQIGGPFYRAQLLSGAENRGGESTLGHMVAEAQRWVTDVPETGGSQIAFMNPGGLRADMLGVGTGDFPRDLTFRQSANVQPFANTLVTMEMTGEQISTLLEQQWQPVGAARPFLKLGTSAGFSYTYDPTAPAGSRILSMSLDGEPIEAATTYKVTANSFLAAGGDNFFEFTNATNVRDSGKSDLVGMVDFMAENSGVAPSYKQTAVGIAFPALAPSTYAPGVQVNFDVTSWAMGSPGRLIDSEIAVSLNGSSVGTAPVDNTLSNVIADESGKASISFTVPVGTPAGTATIKLSGATTGSEVEIPIEINASIAPDVPPSSPFASEINWAMDQGITTGYEDGTFRPALPINRDAVAAMIYRAKNPGQTAPACASAPFTDVPVDHQFCGEIAWLKAEGITTGNADGSYTPASPVSRQATVTFVARAFGPSPLPACSAAPFSDVSASNPFCPQITWAKTEGIANGWPDGTFRPVANVERQAFVAFLYRQMVG